MTDINTIGKMQPLSDGSRKEVGAMDIPALSMYMAQSQTLSSVGVAVLDQNLEQIQGMGDDMTKMLEQSVNPNLGGTIDISL